MGHPDGGRRLATIGELQIGHTRVTLIEGEPINQLSDALYTPANARGVMASGFAGAIRVAAGIEVERELRQHQALLVGEAYLTGSGRLRERAVIHIIHGVTARAPGDAPRRFAVVEALTSGLALLSRTRTRSLTLPEIGTRVPNIELADAADILVATLAGHLRRGSHLERVTIVGLHSAYLAHCHAGLLTSGAVRL